MSARCKKSRGWGTTRPRKNVPGAESPGGVLVAVSGQRNGKIRIVCRKCNKHKLVWVTALYRPAQSCGCLGGGRGPSRNLKKIRALVRAGKSVREAADAIGIRESTVRGLINKYGLKKPRNRRGENPRTGAHITASHRAKAVSFANAHGAREAAKLFGVHERSIVRWRNGYVKKVAA